MIRSLANLLAVALCVLAAAICAGPALAHAGFTGGEPEPGERLPGSPQNVSLSFTEPVSAEFDPVRVTGPGGERVDDGEARVSPGDDRVVEVGLVDLDPGTYRVEYRVTSVDGHVIADAYEFVVLPPAEETTAEATAEATPEETAQATTEPTRPEGSGGQEEGTSGGLGTYALVGLAVVGLGAAGVALARARGA